MQKRIDWIDFAKGFTIFFVVFHHSMISVNYDMTSRWYSLIFNDILGTIVATFIMPVFFAISGYLYSDVKTVKKYIFTLYKKITSLFIVYVIFVILFEWSFYNDTNYDHSLIRIFLTPVGHTWFLYALFIISVIWATMDLLRFNILFKTIVVMILFVLSNYIQNGFLPQFNGFPGLKLTFMFFPYFLVGYILRRYVNINSIFNNKIKASAFVLITALSLFITEVVFHLKATAAFINTKADFFANQNANMTGKNIIPKIFLIILLFEIFMIIPKNNKFCSFVEFTGKYSLIIYLVHGFITGRLCGKLLAGIGISDFKATMAVVLTCMFAYEFSLLIAVLCRYHIGFHWLFFPRKWIDPVVKKTKFGKWMFS